MGYVLIVDLLQLAAPGQGLGMDVQGYRGALRSSKDGVNKAPIGTRAGIKYCWLFDGYNSLASGLAKFEDCCIMCLGQRRRL